MLKDERRRKAARGVSVGPRKKKGYRGVAVLARDSDADVSRGRFVDDASQAIRAIAIDFRERETSVRFFRPGLFPRNGAAVKNSLRCRATVKYTNRA